VKTSDLLTVGEPTTMVITFDFEVEEPVVVAFGALLVAALLGLLAPFEAASAGDVVSKVLYGVALYAPRGRGGDRRSPGASVEISG
jgi:hypothetical protein